MYVRASASNDVTRPPRARDARRAAGGTTSRPSINRLAAGLNPSDMALIGEASARKLLVVSPGSCDAAGDRRRRQHHRQISPRRRGHASCSSPGPRRDPNPAPRALLYGDRSTAAAVSFLELTDIDARRGQNVETVRLPCRRQRAAPAARARRRDDRPPAGRGCWAPQPARPHAAHGVADRRRVSLGGARFDSDRQRLWVAPARQHPRGAGSTCAPSAPDELRLDGPPDRRHPAARPDGRRGPRRRAPTGRGGRGHRPRRRRPRRETARTIRGFSSTTSSPEPPDDRPRPSASPSPSSPSPRQPTLRARPPRAPGRHHRGRARWNHDVSHTAFRNGTAAPAAGPAFGATSPTSAPGSRSASEWAGPTRGTQTRVRDDFATSLPHQPPPGRAPRALRELSRFITPYVRVVAGAAHLAATVDGTSGSSLSGGRLGPQGSAGAGVMFTSGRWFRGPRMGPREASRWASKAGSVHAPDAAGRRRPRSQDEAAAADRLPTRPSARHPQRLRGLPPAHLQPSGSECPPTRRSDRHQPCAIAGARRPRSLAHRVGHARLPRGRGAPRA